MLALATAALLFAVFWTGYHLGETAPIRKKMRERKRIENSLPKANVIKMFAVVILLSSCSRSFQKSVYGKNITGCERVVKMPKKFKS